MALATDGADIAYEALKNAGLNPDPPLPFGLAKLQALLLQFAPGPLKLTPDQVVLLRSDNVVSPTAKAADLTLEFVE